jgi:hypothetical protein
MKRYLPLAIILSLFFLTPCLGADEVKIPERTVVPIKLTQTLKGDAVTVGQSVDFEVSRDVILDNFVVIKHGAPAYGTITSSEEAGYVSKGGKIGFSVDYCKAIDGSKVYLKALLQREAESHTGANIAASVILCPLILAARGEEAEIPAGTEFKSYVENEVFVSVEPGALLTDLELEQLEVATIPKEVEKPSIPIGKLRDTPKGLMEYDIKRMIEKYNFFEKDLNESGDFPNDLVDNGDGTITDRATGLMWEKGGSSSALYYGKAKKYVKRLNQDNFSGYNNWRIPTLEELWSLMEPGVNERGQHINSVFEGKPSKCLATDPFVRTPRAQLCGTRNIVDFTKGKIDETATENISHRDCRSVRFFIRAVRTIK